MAKIPRDERYSLFWRIGWYINYGLLHVYGPASLDEARDPLVAMRRERDYRKAAHQRRRAANGQPHQQDQPHGQEQH